MAIAHDQHSRRDPSELGAASTCHDDGARSAPRLPADRTTELIEPRRRGVIEKHEPHPTLERTLDLATL
jgi:hypothetical protein